jgi:hypothetical protein
MKDCLSAVAVRVAAIAFVLVCVTAFLTTSIESAPPVRVAEYTEVDGRAYEIVGYDAQHRPIKGREVDPKTFEPLPDRATNPAGQAPKDCQGCKCGCDKTGKCSCGCGRCPCKCGCGCSGKCGCGNPKPKPSRP